MGAEGVLSLAANAAAPDNGSLARLRFNMLGDRLGDAEENDEFVVVAVAPHGDVKSRAPEVKLPVPEKEDRRTYLVVDNDALLFVEAPFASAHAPNLGPGIALCGRWAMGAGGRARPIPAAAAA